MRIVVLINQTMITLFFLVKIALANEYYSVTIIVQDVDKNFELNKKWHITTLILQITCFVGTKPHGGETQICTFHGAKGTCGPNKLALR